MNEDLYYIFIEGALGSAFIVLKFENKENTNMQA